MKIYKYEIKDISVGDNFCDLEYLVFNQIIDTFTQTIVDVKVHTITQNSFCFISDQNDQDKMIKIFDDFNNDSNIKSVFGDYEFTYEDVTDEILSNIDNYDSIENFNEKNTILNHYYNVFTPDAILDKIIENGVDSLSKHDKLILDDSVKGK